MAHRKLTRREATTRIAGAAGAGLVLPGLVAAQPRGKPKEPRLKQLIERGRERDWTITSYVHVSADEGQDERRMPDGTRLRFDTAAVVYPIIAGCASSETSVDQVTGELKFNDEVVDEEFEVIENLPVGARYGKWEVQNKVGREVDLKVEIPMKTWAVEFNERIAKTVPWPSAYPPEIANALQPSTYVASGDRELATLVDAWTKGKDPKSLPAVEVAKWFAGNVQEMFQFSGLGETSSRVGLIEGFNLQGVRNTIRRKQGTIHDITCVLAAAYRAIGLPARIVIGYDVTESKGQERNFLERDDDDAELRSWVEFCLYDEQEQVELWVPVDVAEMRRRSSRMGKLDRSWKYFGSHDKLDDRMPLAFHFHPPISGVVAHGSSALWGWFTTPRIQPAEQHIRFVTKTTPRSSKSRRRRGR